MKNKLPDESKTMVVIPTYNNERTLAAVIESVLSHTTDVLVVNDGATDSTSEILKTFADRIRILSYHPNKGKGYALRCAFREALKLGFDHAVTIDSDGQHSAADIPKFIESIRTNPGALLVGSRGLVHDNMASTSTFANRFSNFWFTLQTFRKLPDTQSGFRLYPLYRMGKMKMFTTRYETELEYLVFSAWRNIRIIPIPISVHYDPPSEKVSHFRPFHDFFRISVLNTVLVFLAFIYGYPSMLIRKIAAKF